MQAEHRAFGLQPVDQSRVEVVLPPGVGEQEHRPPDPGAVRTRLGWPRRRAATRATASARPRSVGWRAKSRSGTSAPARAAPGATGSAAGGRSRRGRRSRRRGRSSATASVSHQIRRTPPGRPSSSPGPADPGATVAEARAVRMASRQPGLRSASTLATGSPLTASRAARSERLPLWVSGSSGTATTSDGTCAAEASCRSVRRIVRSSPPSSRTPGRSTTSSTMRPDPGRPGSRCSTAAASVISGSRRSTE